MGSTYCVLPQNSRGSHVVDACQRTSIQCRYVGRTRKRETYGVDVPLGDLGTLDADEKGEAFSSGTKRSLKVVDIIGRAIAVYGTEDKSDSGVAAAVIARSAGVGENYKKLCTCDGKTIWDATNNDFVASKV